MSGKLTPAEQAANDKKDNNAEEVSGLAIFRPCEDWFGEYGFDWYREKEDVFRERLSFAEEDKESKYNSSFIAEGMMRKKMKKSDFNKWQSKHSVEQWKKEELAKKAKYEIEKKEIENNGKLSEEDRNFQLQMLEAGAHHGEWEAIEKNDEKAIQKYYDIYYTKACNEKLDNLYRNNDTKKNKDYVNDAWLNEGNTSDHYFDNVGSLEEDEVFEYCYHPDDVEKVVYHAYGNGSWAKDEVVYRDYPNGDKAASKYSEWFDSSEETRSTEAKELGALNSYIDINGSVKMSCFLEGEKIKIPVYIEEGGTEEKWTRKQKDTKYYLFDDVNVIIGNNNRVTKSLLKKGRLLTAEQIVKECIKSNDEQKKAVITKSGYQNWYSLSDPGYVSICSMRVWDQNNEYKYYKALAPLTFFKRISFYNKKNKYILTYHKIEGKQYLYAVLDYYEALFVDGEVEEVKVNHMKEVTEVIKNGNKEEKKKIKKNVYEWMTLKEALKLEGEEGEKVNALIDAFSNSCLDNNWYTNKDLRIDDLAKKSDLRFLEVTIMNPRDMVFVEGSVKEERAGYSNEKKKYYRPNNDEHKFEVVEWKEAYKKSMGYQRIQHKEEQGKYYYSTLSTTLWQEKDGEQEKEFDDGRRRLKVRSFQDVPKVMDKDPNNPNEYKIQLFYKQLDGSCHKLRVESNCPMLSIKANGSADYEEKVFLDPKDQSICLKVGPCKKDCKNKCAAFYGSGPKDHHRFYQPYLTAFTLTEDQFNKDKDKKGLFAGRLYAQLSPAWKYPIYVVKVNAQDLSGDYNKAVEEQFVALKNTLMQVGIVPEIKQLDPIMVKDIVDKNKRVILGDNTYSAALSALKTSNEEVFENLHQFLIVFIVGKSFDNVGVAGFSKTWDFDGKPFRCIWLSNALVMDRGTTHLFSHEVLHALGLSHIFQLKALFHEGDFCFPYARTSNIMDYHTSNYSLHKFQWDKMRENAYGPCKAYYKMTHKDK